MRFVALFAILVLIAPPAFAQKPPQQQAPQPPQLQPQAQEGIATPRGWRREASPNGTIYFHCAGANTCQEGDLVSYRIQGQGRAFTLDTFREQQERVNRVMRTERGFRNVAMAAPRDESRGDTIVFVADLDLTDSRGSNSAMISAYFARNQQNVTIISTAPTRAAARDNIAVFRAAVISWLANPR